MIKGQLLIHKMHQTRGAMTGPPKTYHPNTVHLRRYDWKTRVRFPLEFSVVSKKNLQVLRIQRSDEEFLEMFQQWSGDASDFIEINVSQKSVDPVLFDVCRGLYQHLPRGAN